MNLEKRRFSVVMTVCDNAQELESNLPAYLSQKYEPGYKVIVVDESSTDGTEDVLKLQKQGHPHLYTTFLPKPNLHAKRRMISLSIGVKAAVSEWIILTDINYVPPSAEWLKQTGDVIDSTTELLFGYNVKKGLKLQTFDQLEDGLRLVRKNERKGYNGKNAHLLKFLRGHYDYIAVPTSRVHDVLHYFEQDVSGHCLLGLRISVMYHNLFA